MPYRAIGVITVLETYQVEADVNEQDADAAQEAIVKAFHNGAGIYKGKVVIPTLTTMIGPASMEDLAAKAAMARGLADG